MLLLQLEQEAELVEFLLQPFLHLCWLSRPWRCRALPRPWGKQEAKRAALLTIQISIQMRSCHLAQEGNNPDPGTSALMVST